MCRTAVARQRGVCSNLLQHALPRTARPHDHRRVCFIVAMAHQVPSVNTPRKSTSHPSHAHLLRWGGRGSEAPPPQPLRWAAAPCRCWDPPPHTLSPQHGCTYPHRLPDIVQPVELQDCLIAVHQHVVPFKLVHHERPPGVAHKVQAASVGAGAHVTTRPPSLQVHARHLCRLSPAGSGARSH